MMLLNQFVETGRLGEFVLEFIEIRNEETKEKVQWEYFLHKVYNMSWEEFAGEKPEEQEADMDKIEEQVKASLGILENFRMN